MVDWVLKLPFHKYHHSMHHHVQCVHSILQSAIINIVKLIQGCMMMKSESDLGTIRMYRLCVLGIHLHFLWSPAFHVLSYFIATLSFILTLQSFIIPTKSVILFFVFNSDRMYPDILNLIHSCDDLSCSLKISLPQLFLKYLSYTYSLAIFF